MEISKKKYQDYQIDFDVVNSFSITFIEKYHLLPYLIVDNKLIVLVDEFFNTYHLNKISFFVDLNYELIMVSNDEWEKVFKLVNYSNRKDDAILKYQINSDQVDSDQLKESNLDFYQAEIENSPIVKLVDSIIGEAISLKSSDIHIEPMDNAIRVRLRIDGKLMEKTKLPLNSLSEIVTRIKVLANLDITKKLVPQDGKLKFTYNNINYDIRVSIIPAVFGEKIALRILSFADRLFTIEDLALDPIAKTNILKLLDTSAGLILVVGPTGSGKSTSLQAFLHKNLERNENIITVEDPVEYSIPEITQIQVNEEAGLDFAICLKTILRQDPNIIMVGEIRDIETAKIACRAAITGHLVYSTLHTNSSIGVINRLKDMNIDNYLLVDALRGIVSQRLVRCLCKKCRKKKTATTYESNYLGIEAGSKIYYAVGCPSCNMTGYSGRRGIYEVIILDEDFKKLISENASNLKYLKLIEKKGFESLFEYGKKLVLQGDTTIEELQSVLN